MGEIAAAEDRPHYPAPGAKWLESYWFGFIDPRTRLSMVSLIGFNQAESRSRLWLHMFEDNRCTMTETQLDLPLAAPDGDSVTVGGFRLQFVADLREFAIAYSSVEACLDLRWLGTSDAKATTGGRPFPGQTAQEPHGHSEQAGMVSGAVRIGDRSYDLHDAYGWRDHLWGHAITDGWSEMGWWAWLVGTTQDRRLSFNISSHVFPDGRAGHYGFMFVDGKVHKTLVHECAVETDSGGRHPLACSMRWTDSDDGVDYVADGEIYGPLHVEEPVSGNRVCIINDAPSHFRVNGKAAYGTIEMGAVWPV